MRWVSELLLYSLWVLCGSCSVRPCAEPWCHPLSWSPGVHLRSSAPWWRRRSPPAELPASEDILQDVRNDNFKKKKKEEKRITEKNEQIEINKNNIINNKQARGKKNTTFQILRCLRKKWIIIEMAQKMFLWHQTAKKLWRTFKKRKRYAATKQQRLNVHLKVLFYVYLKCKRPFWIHHL